jgi:adenylate kinase
MNILLLGPQGSGKGTQAELLEKKYGMQYFEAGKILRSIAKSDNPQGKVVRESLEKGQLVPDEFTRLIAWDFINKHNKDRGFIFDGYPRSLLQYEHLEDMLMKFGKKIDRVVFIEISEAESVKRLSARRTCDKCGEIYNLITNPSPAGDNKCPCGGNLVHRADDQPEAIKTRLQIYREKTLPILEKAKQEGILLEVNGERSIETIHEEIATKLGLEYA